MSETLTPKDEASIIRAGAHSAAPIVLRAAQRFRLGVTDLDVARVMRLLELGHRPYRNRAGAWYMPTSARTQGANRTTSTVITEMIRTGLVRHYRDRDGDHLIPAPVHCRNLTDPRMSACLFVGEDMGPMRSRLVCADRLDLVDCLACEQAVAMGKSRGL